jgi:hypothetical protein
VLSLIDETEDETLLSTLTLSVYVDVEVGSVYDKARLPLDWDLGVGEKLLADVLVSEGDIPCEAVLLLSAAEDVDVAYELDI